MGDTLALLGGEKAVSLTYPKYPVINADEVCAATRVVMYGQLSDIGRGPVIAQLEDDLAAYFGADYCLSCSSGTAAIHEALFAVGASPGSEVLIANHNWISPIMAVFHAGCVPVLCDVREDGYSIDPEEIRRKVTPHTKAVIATHLWGIPADMDAIMAVAREFGLAVIEDVSHAHGGKYKGQYLGTIGDVGCFSLQGSKAMVAGEGGFLLTNNERYYQRAIIPGHHTCRLASDVIMEEVKPFSEAGGMYTYRMTPVCTAIAVEQLKKLPHMNAARHANFERLYAGLADLPFLTWPELADGSVRGYYGTPALYDAFQMNGVRRFIFQQACLAEGVEVDGEKYADWSRIPILTDLDLLSQMFVVKHTNGVAYTPLAPGALPNNVSVSKRMLVFSIPAVEAPALMDQVIAAVHKVADHIDDLVGYELPVAV